MKTILIFIATFEMLASTFLIYDLYVENQDLKFQLKIATEQNHNKVIEQEIGSTVYIKPDSTEAIIVSKGGYYRADGANFKCDYTVQFTDSLNQIQIVHINKELLY